MSSDKPPSTPPPGIPPNPQSFESTPHSHGSSSNYLHQSQHHQSNYKPYLLEDLKHQYIVPFDDFLHEILHLPLDWIEQNDTKISSILDGNKSKFKAMVSRYQQPVDHETHRYSSFVVLANHIIDKLDRSLFRFCRNDPAIVQNSAAQRKPDVAVVCRESVEDEPERSSVDNLMDCGPKGAPFWWAELLSFWEFKLDRKDLRKSVERGPRTRDRSSTVVPSTSKSASRSRSRAQSKGRPENLSPTEPPSHPMTTRSSSRSSSSSTTSLKRPSPAASEDTSQISKKQKVEDVASADKEMLQCASYALELLSNGGLRSHVIGALVTDEHIELLYYDRSIVIVSQPLNFLEDGRRFIATIQAIANLSFRQWGYAGLLMPAPRLKEPRTPDVFEGLKLTLNDGTVLKLGRTIFHQHCLIGRGTLVVQANRIDRGMGPNVDDGVWNGPLIVKLSWPSRTRTPEHVIIEEARNLADNDEDRWVLNHLPKVLHHEDVIDCLLSEKLIDLMADNYEGRVLRIIVQEELSPITERTTAGGLAQSFYEIFMCYRWLYERARIIHRDVSVNNLMLRKAGGKIYGVLNDFDLAVRVDARAASSKQRTGTQPFMAIDLLLPGSIVHLFRHDLESMFYDLVWLTSRFKNGKEITNPPLQEWENYGGQALADRKTTFITDEACQLTKEYEPLVHWTYSMQEMMRRGRSMRADYRRALKVAEMSQTTPPEDFEDETLGGMITFENFQAILETKNQQFELSLLPYKSNPIVSREA